MKNKLQIVIYLLVLLILYQRVFGQDVISFSKFIPNDLDGVRSVFAIDLDQDGDMDLVAVSDRDDKVAWFENDGTENFTEHIVSDTSHGAYFVLAVDLDGDMDNDIVTALNLADKVIWHENNGNESFTEHTISETVVEGVRTISAVDLDGDMDLDVLSASFGNDKISWYENLGNKSFNEHNISDTADGASCVATADINGDGNMDVLSASYYDNKVSWYENDGDEQFTEHIISSKETYSEYLAATDIDNDGKMDVVASSAGKILVYRQVVPSGIAKNISNKIFFGKYVVTDTAECVSKLSITDFNGDEYPDILAGCGTTFSIFENRRNGKFIEHVISDSANTAKSILAADIDNDTDPDIITANYQGKNNMAIYKSNLCNPASITHEVSICSGEAYYAGGDYQTNPGTYYDAYGCDSIVISELTILECSTGIGTDSPAGLTVYPVPAEGEINIALKDFASAALLDIRGNVILRSEDPGIDLTFIPAGIYFLRIYDLEGNYYVRKVLVQ